MNTFMITRVSINGNGIDGIMRRFTLPFPSGWTTSSTEPVHQLRPNAQPDITKG